RLSPLRPRIGEALSAALGFLLGVVTEQKTSTRYSGNPYFSSLSTFSNSSFGMTTVGSIVFANRMSPVLSMINQERLGRIYPRIVLGFSSSAGVIVDDTIRLRHHAFLITQEGVGDAHLLHFAASIPAASLGDVGGSILPVEHH